MKRQEIWSSVLALLAAPSLVLVQTLAGPTSWVLFVLALTSASVALFAWQLVSTYKWALQTEPHTVCIRGSDFGLASAVAILAFYTVWLVGPHVPVPASSLVKILLCLYNWVLLSSLSSSAHVSLVYTRRWGRLLWAPFVVQLGLLPWFMPDRCPLPPQPRWPSYWHHASAGFSLALSCLCCSCPGLRITLMLEPQKRYTPAAGGVCTYYERLPQVCALLSMLYLTAVYMWESFGAVAFWQGFYHLVWAALRPAYAALFAVYGLKGSAYLPAANKIACGLGFVFFTALATLTETPMTLHSPNMFEKRTEFSHIGAHGVEALCFFLSIVLFYVHGLTSGAWQDGESQVFRCVPFAALMCGLAVALFSFVTVGEFLRYTYGIKITLIDHGSSVLNNQAFYDLERLLRDYLFPYGSIVFAVSYITARRSTVPRHLLIFEVEGAEGEERVQHHLLTGELAESGSEKQALKPPARMEVSNPELESCGA